MMCEVGLGRLRIPVSESDIIDPLPIESISIQWVYVSKSVYFDYACKHYGTCIIWSVKCGSALRLSI
jgi:hypothetical protein